VTERRLSNIRRLNLPNFVVVTYTLFLAGFFFVPNAVDQYKFYIAAVFLPGLLLLPIALRQIRGSFIWISLLAYLAYMLLSSLWSDTFSPAMLWRDARYTAYVLMFILLTVYFFQRNRRLPQAIMLFVTLVAIVAAFVSVLTFPDVALLPELTEHRLVGIGTMKNPNPSAFIYGFCGVFALDYARRNRSGALGWFCASGVLVIFLLVILTQSNTGLLALSSACALLLFTDHRNGRISRRALFLGFVMVMVSAVFLAWSLGLVNKSIDLGFVNRLPIWRHVVQLWMASPIFGQGYQVTQVLGPGGTPSIMNYAHSLFLSTLRDGGLIGLALLLLVYFFALRSALKMAVRERRSLYLSLFLFGLVCVLADTDQIVTRPRELWVILWLPLACLMARELGLAGEGSPNSAAIKAARSPKKI
jgi:O-antigen ligase